MNTQKHPLEYFCFCPHCGSSSFLPSGPRSKKCAHCGFHFFFNPSAAVAALITDTQGRLLLTRRAFEPEKGTFDLPGGFAELGETIEDALRREVREELGIEIRDLNYYASQPNRYPFSGFTVHTLDVFFTAQIAPDQATLHAADDVESYVWLSAGEIDPEKVGLESIRTIVAKWKEENR